MSAPARSTATTDLGLLVIRLAIGVAMALHGTQKLFGWFGGGGIHGTGTFLAASGYPPGTLRLHHRHG